MIDALTEEEKHILNRGLQAAMATFFVDGIEDFIWEAIFCYAKGLEIVDPLSETRKKLLFDIVDNKNNIGWSAKTTTTTSFVSGQEVEVVIQRADIFGKNSLLSKDSPPAVLGKTLLEHWYEKVNNDAAAQQVTDKRVCILLKSKKYTQYAYIEESLEEFDTNTIEWEWTNANKKGLQGRHNGRLKFRWYPSGGQLFERFVLPEDLEVINIKPERLPADVVMNFLINTLESLEFSEQN